MVSKLVLNPLLPELPDKVTFDGVGLLLLCIGLVLLLSGINAIRVKSKKVDIANKKPAAYAGLVLSLLGLVLIAYPEPESGDKPVAENPPTKAVIASQTPVAEEPVDVDPTLTPVPPDETPVLLNGDIFNVKCLENSLWDPITNINVSNQVASTGQACLELLDWGITFNDSSVRVFRDPTGHPGIYGIKAPIPANAYIEVSIQVENIAEGYAQFGVISDGESLKDVDGAFAALYPDGRVQLLSMDAGKEKSEKVYRLPEIPSGTLNYIIEVDGNELLIQRIGAEDDYKKLSIPFAPRYLFLGYESLDESDIRIHYFDLMVEER